MKTSWIILFTAGLALGHARETLITRDAKEVHPGIISYTVESEYQKGPNKLEVLLPDDYSPKKKYPVVYLLPVNVGTDGQWGSGIVEAQKRRLNQRHQVICVAPAYEVLPWFGDNPLKPEVRQNSYLLKVVIPFIEKSFATQKEKEGRWLIGFSKSGLGGLGLFFHHLDLFGRIAVFDFAMGPPTQASYEKWGFAETYGPRENFDQYDPIEMLRKYGPELKEQPRRITILAGGPGSRIGVDSFRSRLIDAKVPHVYILGTNQGHTWTSGWLPFAFAGVADGDGDQK